MGRWSAKRAGIESGGAGERSFGKKFRSRSEPELGEVSDFWSWRRAVLGSLTKAGIPWSTRDDGTIEARFSDGLRTLSLQEQQEDYKKWKEKKGQSTGNVEL